MENELKISVVADFSQFDKEFKRAEKAVEGLDGALEETGKDAQKAGKEITDSFKNLPNRVKKLKEETEKLNKSFKENRISVADFTRKSDALEKEMNSLRKTAQKAGVEVEVFGKKATGASKTASTGFKAMGTALKSALLPLIGFFAAIEASKALAKFEKQIFDIGTLLGDTAAEEMPKFQAGLLEIAKNSPTTAEELGLAAYAAVSAGITDTAEALEVVAESAKLGVAGLGSTEAATDLVTSALNAFKEEGLEADDAANLLFETVKNGKTTVDEISQSFGSVAPVAAAAGIKFAELQAATAALTTTGLKASEAQTQIRAATLALIKPSENLAGLFEELGIESGKALIEQEGLVGALDILTDAVDNDETAISGLIGSVEGFNATLALTGPVAEAFENTLSDLTDGVGSLDDAFELQRQTVAAQFQELKNGLFALLISAGEVILPVLNAAIGTLNTIIEKTFIAFDKLAGVVRFFVGESVLDGFNRSTKAIEEQKQVVEDLTEAIEKNTEERIKSEEELTKIVGEEATKRAIARVKELEGAITLQDALLEEVKKTQTDATSALTDEAKARLSVSIAEAEAIRSIEKGLQEEIESARREAINLAIDQINTLQAKITSLRGVRLVAANARVDQLEARLAEGGFDLFGQTQDQLTKAREDQADILGELEDAQVSLEKSIISGAKDLLDLDAEQFSDEISKITTPEGLEKLTKEFDNIRDATEKATQAEKDRKDGLADLVDGIDIGTDKTEDNTKATGGATKATEKLDDATKELGKNAKEAIKGVNDEYKSYEQTLKDVQKLQESINKATAEFVESGGAGSASTGEDLGNLERERVNDLTNELVDLNKEIEDAAGDSKKVEELKQQRELLRGIIEETKNLIGEQSVGLFEEAERVSGLSEEEAAQEAFEIERERLQLRKEIFEATTQEELEALEERAGFENGQLIFERIEKLKTIELETQQKLEAEETLAAQRLSIENEIKDQRIQDALEVGAVEQAEAEKLKAILESIRSPLLGGGGIIPQAHEGGIIGGTTGSTPLRSPGMGEVLTMTNPGEFIIPNNLNKLSAQNQAHLMNRIAPLINRQSTSNSTSNNNSINGVTVNIAEQPFRSVEDFRRVIRKIV